MSRVDALPQAVGLFPLPLGGTGTGGGGGGGGGGRGAGAAAQTPLLAAPWMFSFQH